MYNLTWNTGLRDCANLRYSLTEGIRWLDGARYQVWRQTRSYSDQHRASCIFRQSILYIFTEALLSVYSFSLILLLANLNSLLTLWSNLDISTERSYKLSCQNIFNSVSFVILVVLNTFSYYIQISRVRSLI